VLVLALCLVFNIEGILLSTSVFAKLYQSSFSLQHLQQSSQTTAMQGRIRHRNFMKCLCATSSNVSALLHEVFPLPHKAVRRATVRDAWPREEQLEARTRQLRSILLWPPYVIGGQYIFLPCDFYLSIVYLSFFPRLISAATDWISTILLHMAWP